MKIIRTVFLLSVIVIALLLAGCAALQQAEPTPTAAPEEPTGAVIPTATAAVGTEPVLGLATVESIEIQTLESFPVQINVRVTGVLPDDCTEVNEPIGERDGDTFTVAVTTTRDPGAGCSADETFFEAIVPLEVTGLEAGSYNVSVNGVEGSFRLDVDNVSPEEGSDTEPAASPEPTATAEAEATQAAGSYSIEGRVWHDVCANDATEAGGGCVAAEDGQIIGDGLFDDEPGIEGVRVNLGAGPCPSSESIVTATTDGDGRFTFVNLEAAQYCVSIDEEGAQNQDILQPGLWTAPAVDEANTAVTLSEEEAAQEVNFGWDYELLPVDLADCSNSFEFIEDLNVPDDSVFAPGEEFVKRWRVRNNGNCPWSTDYSVLFVGGEQLSPEESTPLSQSVPVSGTLDVAVPMVAPLEAGTYRGNFQIADPNGEPFGIDGNIEDAFWLQIVVEEGAEPNATAAPNSGTIGGVVWDDFCINSNPGRGCVEAGEGSGVWVADGGQDGLEPALPDITITLAEGACPGDGTLPSDSAVIDTAVTDADGLYRFEGLETGTYCIFMDALSPENVDLLIPGNWTWPATGVGQYTFILDPGEQALDLDFGWDYAD